MPRIRGLGDQECPASPRLSHRSIRCRGQLLSDPVYTIDLSSEENGQEIWEKKKEGRIGLSGLRRDRRPKLHNPPQNGRRKTQTQEVLPAIAQAHAARRKEKVILSARPWRSIGPTAKRFTILALSVHGRHAETLAYCLLRSPKCRGS